MSFPKYEERVLQLKQLFSTCSSQEDRYKKIIELGAFIPPMPPENLQEIYLVPGCQSLLYLKVSVTQGLLSLEIHADALISKGLAAILYIVYNQLPVTILLQCAPTFLQDLGIIASLSPSRSQGFASIYLTMRQRVLHVLSTAPSSSDSIC